MFTQPKKQSIAGMQDNQRNPSLNLFDSFLSSITNTRTKTAKRQRIAMAVGFALSICVTQAFATPKPTPKVTADTEKSSEQTSAPKALSAAEQFARTTLDGKGAVASVHPLATQAGLDAFAKGGNAIDAALAVAFTLGVVDSNNSGIGGGCFILVRQADGSIMAIDGREIAPAAATRDMFLKNGKAEASLSKTGALAIGVPGSVAAFDYLQQHSGKLNFSDVILPAATLAEKGFPISDVMAKRLQRTYEDLQKFPASAEIFLHKDGSAKKRGETLIQKDLAETYRNLAKEGPDYFYKGEFASAVSQWMKQNDGLVTQKDFRNYQLLLRNPVKTKFKQYDVLGFPPPSSGGVHVAQILNMMEQYDLPSMSEVQRYHVLIEAMKLAFADRAHWLGDPAFAKVPKGLIAKSYAKQLAEKISLKKAQPVESFHVPPGAESELFDKHTTHIATADKEGNWVAITTTLNTSFGSKVTIPGTGVLMNNQMDDFSAQPGVPNAFGLVGSEANSVRGGKRPLSSMSPTLVLYKNQPVMTVGAAGGPTIITQVVQALMNRLALDYSLEESLQAVRVHHQWRPDMVYIDGFATDAFKSALAKYGHTLKIWPPFGATQAIAIQDGEFQAVAEPRLVSGDR
ncbi:Gamma-glutamyltranspeptidase [Thalassocella blandensis]|nr:Gamma-glutamyltranspeptidase [Thalassocella blandensis]